ncbi:hypothetical protein LEP1GSC188_0836 [Leptospira weilii serovar Topaz str. LT2116]|uniref:Uncharacterized protein n=1 Tax=Leptospira weilii serovar Topaz str. LT2116 TaxID=1088540 RepID=M3G7P7_9LEPT|nr:hypothetical protein LEP1GSC188_0836 [Leptospira weilii serovar Topaz str. LT2116]
MLILVFTDKSVEAQIQIGGQYYSGLLWGENEILSSEYYNDGSFLRTDQDFILTAGRNWKGDPPPSRGSFLFEKKKFTTAGFLTTKRFLFWKKEKPKTDSEQFPCWKKACVSILNFFLSATT